MRTLLMGVLAMVLVTADDKHDPDIEKMQGTWVLVSTADGLSGQKETRPTDRGFKLVVKGNTRKGFQGERSGKEFTFTVDSTKNPKRIDTFHPDAGHLKGIYELDGDTMRSSYSPPGKDRPASFATTPSTISVYERERRRP